MTEQTSLYVPADAAGAAELSREWLAARVVLAAGFVIAIAFVTYWTLTHRPAALDGLGDVTADTAPAGSEGVAIPDSAAGQSSKEGIALCRLAILTAENFGIVPTTMAYAGGPGKTDVQGRYVCAANDTASQHYTITVDLVCKDLNNPNCVNMFRATKGDTALYQRQGDPVLPGAPVDTAPSEGAPADGATDGSGASDAGAASDGSTPPADGTEPPPQ